jgi:hypothetical protein
MRAGHITAPLEIKYGHAQHYIIDKADNCFYFFNPFAVHIFEKVVSNIIHSVEKDQRTVDLILYYPFPEYIDLLRATPFTIVKEIEVPGATHLIGGVLIADKSYCLFIFKYNTLYKIGTPPSLM